MYRKIAIYCLPLLLLAIPLCLRQSERTIAKDTDDILVIVTPHTEMIKHEFARAFERHYKEKTGRTIRIDYRNMGGTSDIVRYIADRYAAEFRRAWEKTNPAVPWSDELAGGFAAEKKAPSPLEKEARKMFLNSDIGIGIDLFFGGGTYEHRKQAESGYAVDAKVRERHPEYFQSEIMPMTFGGDQIYDEEGRFYATCLSSFGICANPDILKEKNLPPPRCWRDLADAAFFRNLVAADPTKSGSINKCFEVMLQEAFARTLKAGGTLNEGWQNGFAVIRRILANSRYIADSAGKVTREVASGNAACGMSIDFYSFSENEWSRRCFDGESKIVYITPIGGTAVSPDPIQLLRGAPNRRAAELFIDFVLSREGQQLWDYRVGTPGGPVRYALRRPPVRKDLYGASNQPFMADPDYNPYLSGNDFAYNPQWTAKYFNLIRVIIKTTMLDVHEEMQSAWGAILRAGGETRVPQAVRAFDSANACSYNEAGRAAAMLRISENNSALDIAACRRAWSDRARACYREAERLAKEGK